MIYGLDLFSGIGAISLAIKDWVRPIAYCEIDIYCQGILLSRISNGSLSNAPIWNDINTISYDGRNWPRIDIIYGGFPCQDISIAKIGEGLEGKRSGLFFEVVRLCSSIKPRFIFLENVPAITCRGGMQVVREITAMGYDVRWCIISAASIGSPHKRKRWFLLAYSKSERFKEERQSLREEEKQSRPDSIPEYKTWYEGKKSPPEFYRVDDDTSFRVDRVKCLGNSVCVEQAKEAFKILMGIK